MPGGSLVPGGGTTPSSPNWQQPWQPPWWLVPAIETVTGIGGAIYSNRQNEQKEAKSAALQREFAQMGIRWRVEDAKAAGLHPLFALGGQLPQFSPAFSTDSVGPALANAGQSVGRAIASQETTAERQAQALAMQLLESQIRETDARAGLARAETLRAFRDSGSGFPPVNMPEANLIGEAASTSGGAELRAPQVFMSRPGDSGVTAGPAGPALKEYDVGGLKAMLPAANDLGEALEPLSESPILAYGIYKENVNRYGAVWADRFFERYAPWFLKAIQHRIDDTNLRKTRTRWGKSESLRGRYKPWVPFYKR